MVISGKKVVNSNRQNSSSRACLPLRMLAYQLQFRKKAACVHAPLNTCISPKKIACVAMRVTLNLFRKKKSCMRAYTAAIQRQKGLCTCFLVITNFTGEIILCFVLPGSLFTHYKTNCT